MSRRSTDPIDEVAAAIQALTGRVIDADDRRRFQQYLDLFLRWNRTHRMTTLASPTDVVRELFVDSLLFLALLPARPLAIVDVGAGAGIPGLPLKLADPRLSLTLVEARRKRVSFLLAARRELGLDRLEVVEGRAERLVEQEAGLAGAFDVVVARAVGAAAALLPVAFKYLKGGGVFIASGPPHPIVRAPLEVVRVSVPGTQAARAFLKAVKES